MKKMLKVFQLILVVLMISSVLITPASAVVVATDNNNDVSLISWNGTMWTSTTTSKPEIDITQIEYGKTSQGNASVTLTLSAAPILDAEHHYIVTLGNDSDTNTGSRFSFVGFAGSLTGTFDDSNSGSILMSLTDAEDNTYFGTENIATSDLVVGNTLVWILPTELDDLLSPDPFTIEYPDNPVDLNWVVTAVTLSGVDLTIVGTQASTWTVDYYPDTDNIYDTSSTSIAITGTETLINSSSDESTTASGFDVFSLGLGLGLLVLVVSITKKNKKS